MDLFDQALQGIWAFPSQEATLAPHCCLASGAWMGSGQVEGWVGFFTSHRISGGSGKQLAVLGWSSPVYEAMSTGGVMAGLEPIVLCIRGNYCQLPAVASL